MTIAIVPCTDFKWRIIVDGSTLGDPVRQITIPDINDPSKSTSIYFYNYPIGVAFDTKEEALAAWEDAKKEREQERIKEFINQLVVVLEVGEKR